MATDTDEKVSLLPSNATDIKPTTTTTSTTKDSNNTEDSIDATERREEDGDDEDSRQWQAKRRNDRNSFLGMVLFIVLMIHISHLAPNPAQWMPSWHHGEGRPCGRSGSGSQGVGEVVATAKVPLEVHIMSKCPDARDCLEELVVPAMANVSDKVDFKMSYIGKTTTEDDGVECMHGATECLGNILELCAATVYPDPKIYLGFTLCLSRSYEEIPARELIYGCCLEHGMDFDALNDCASEDDGGYGMDLLQASVERSSELNVTKSCTIRLNDEVRCIRDGGKWSDCEDGSSVESLVDDIKELYKDSNAEAT